MADWGGDRQVGRRGGERKREGERLYIDIYIDIHARTLAGLRPLMSDNGLLLFSLIWPVLEGRKEGSSLPLFLLLFSSCPQLPPPSLPPFEFPDNRL